jgi:hypothetical protein
MTCEDSNEQERLRVISVSRERGDFVQDVDGFFYFWPEEATEGYFSPHHLRWLADELDKLNEPWQKEIDDYHEKHPTP